MLTRSICLAGRRACAHGRLPANAAALIFLVALPAAAQNSSAPAKPPATAQPGGTIQVKREVPGDFLYSFLSPTGQQTAPAPLPSPAGTDALVAVSVPAGYKPGGGELEIADVVRGNVALFPIDTHQITDMTEGSFKYVQSVRVPVQAQGKPVYGPLVTLSAAGSKAVQSHVLAPADYGVAQFTNVPIGVPITVSVVYGGHAPKSLTDTLTLDHPADGKDMQPLVVDWTDVKTTAAAPQPASASTPAPAVAPAAAPAAGATPAQSEGGGGLVNTLVSLLILAGIAYGVYWAYNTGRIKQGLEHLGIQTAPIATDAAAANPFTKPEKPPIQPITEGTADPLFAATSGGPAPPLQNGSGPRLVTAGGAHAGQAFVLTGSQVSIGRDPSNPVALQDDTNVSRRHAVIQANGGEYAVIDTGSSNGTYVNGVRVPANAPQPLRPGDEIIVGGTRLRFEA